MLKIQPLKTMLGFGENLRRGECFFSQGMRRVGGKIKPNWKVATDVISPGDSSTQLLRINWFAQRYPDSTNQKYAVQTDGKIYGFDNATEKWLQLYAPSASSGNGLIVDQKNRLLYARNQYLGMFNGTDPWATYLDWKTFDSTITDFRPMETYEDWVLIGNKNKVAILSVMDGSDTLNNDGFVLPTDFLVRCIKAGRTGVLLGANFRNRGYLILWNVYDTRSSAPWIPLDTKIVSISIDKNGTWIVTTESGEIFITDGYSIRPLVTLPDRDITDKILSAVIPAGTLIFGSYLIIVNSAINQARLKQGLLIYDMETKTWQFSPVNQMAGITMGALFLDSNLDISISWQSSTPAGYYIGKLINGLPNLSYYIVQAFDNGIKKKVAEGVIADLIYSPTTVRYSGAFTPKITASIYNFSRPLYGRAFTSQISPAVNKIYNTGTNSIYKAVEKGDEITILNGINAGEVRHIIDITAPDTVNELWTLDSNLPNLTEASVDIGVMPFKKISEKTIKEDGEYYFDVKNRVRGRNFMIKITLTGFSHYIIENHPEIAFLGLVYDEKGVI